MGFRRSLVRIQSPRLLRKFKSRSWLRKQLATGFELFPLVAERIALWPTSGHAMIFSVALMDDSQPG